MYKDTLIIAKKEFQELKSSIKRLLYILVLLLPAFACVIEGTSRVLPINLAVLVIPIIMGLGASGQLLFDSLLSERKAKTLDVLLSTGISKPAIIIGKVIPAAVIAYCIQILSVLIIKYGFLLIRNKSIFTFAWYIFAIPPFFYYFVACLSLTSTIIISDEKVAAMAGSFTSIGILAFVGYIINKLGIRFNDIGLLIILVISILFCIFVTILTSELLKRVVLITKL